MIGLLLPIRYAMFFRGQKSSESEPDGMYRGKTGAHRSSPVPIRTLQYVPLPEGLYSIGLEQILNIWYLSCGRVDGRRGFTMQTRESSEAITVITVCLASWHCSIVIRTLPYSSTVLRLPADRRYSAAKLLSGLGRRGRMESGRQQWRRFLWDGSQS